MARKRRAFVVADDETEDEIVVATPGYLIKRQKTDTSTDDTSSKGPGSGVLTPATSQSELDQTLPTRRSTRPQDKAAESPDVASSESEDASDSDANSQKRNRRSAKVYRELSYVAAQGPAFPRSTYGGWRPPLEQVAEFEATTRLRTAFEEMHARDMESPEHTYFRLDHFSIYRRPDNKWHPLELVTLEKLSQDRFAEFLFDGILSVGDEKCYVQGVPFRTLTVDGYGEPEDGEADAVDLGSQMCIQSKIGQRQDVWYQLGTPASEYQRFYRPFLWLARFTKHFVDYLLVTKNVTLGHFRNKFYTWLLAKYGAEASFTSWLSEAKLKDFCTTVAANYAYCYKECYGIDNRLCRHPLWGEVDPYRLKAIPRQPDLEKNTIVTPYAFECFHGMYFGGQLEERAMSSDVLSTVEKRKEELHLTPRYVQQYQSTSVSALTPESAARDSPEPLLNVRKGDVVCVRPDANTEWGAAAHAWFAYVQNVRSYEDRNLMDVLWLYEPKDTTLGKAYYPFKNELFMSDNCDCGKAALDLDCAVQKVDVSWFAQDPYTERGLFVRQKFRTVHEQDTYDFIALQESDFTCQCEDQVPIFEECRVTYASGDTVLIREWNDRIQEDRLQPAQIVAFDCKRMRVQLRRCSRKIEVDPMSNARPNELLMTSELFDLPPSSIIRKCHVRFFTQAQDEAGDIVTPYDRDGTGDFFYIVSEGAEDKSQESMSKLPAIDNDGEFVYADEPSSIPLRQGWDPRATPSKPKLTGMGIFCGGGTFDRGLEEGGGVQFRYAVDWASEALHSYRANVRHPEKVHYFLGSVNDYLATAMAGHYRTNKTIAGPGDVQFKSAGSPCPGFSALQTNKNSEESMRNASMVASVVSYVDFYSPLYFMLENVVTMTNGMGPQRDENVFSQIVAALVGLGYQVQQFLMESWSHGSPQSRPRVFIMASAPGLPPYPRPNYSHAHPPGLKTKSLGKSSNGLRFGKRRDEYTPFQHMSARQAAGDLPFLGDAQPQLCTEFPDHRTATYEPTVNRNRIAAVPVRPPGIGLIQAKDAGLLRGEPLEHCNRVNDIRKMPTSKMFARVPGNGLIPTIVTRLAVGDGIAGRVVHWDQHRILTIMEARRAQGYLDHEVLVGKPTDQLKIVGNSVDRKVALVLGLALRESWMGSHYQHHDQDDDSRDSNDQRAASVDDALEEDNDEDDEGPKDEDMPDVGEDGEDESEAYDTAEEEVDEADLDMLNIDNRTAKIALHLSPDEIEEVRRDQFKAIRRILEERAGGAS